MTVTCLIIDDEPLAIEVIKKYIEQTNEITTVETFTNAIDALKYLKNNQVDVIFSDINMPLLDGVNFIKTLTEKPLIIFTTAHEEFALESYELDVLDYLVKPISFPRFLNSVNKIIKILNQKKGNNKPEIQQSKPYTFIKIDKKKLQKIYFDDILVIECLKDYLKISTTTKKFLIHETLSNFTEKLPSNNFVRIHRSYTVAKNKIEAIEGNSVEIDGVRYTIGRSYIDKVKDLLIE